MEFRFCPLCGAHLAGEYIKGRSFPHCPTGHFTAYRNQIVGVAGVICSGETVLLERRAIEPGYGLWALPGGMAEPGETTEECLRREAAEETGLQVSVGRLLGVKGGLKVCIVFHEAAVAGGTLAKSGESLELRWFTRDQVPWAEFAFPRHRAVLEEWFQQRQPQ